MILCVGITNAYNFAMCVVLAVAYVVFMKKYYHLHEEYLASLKKQ